MALVTVLLMLAILSALATALLATSISQRVSVARYGESVQLDAVADSAMRVRLAQLAAAAQRGQPEPLGSTVVELPFGAAQVEVQREDSRIDLNSADDALLFAFLAANGYDQPAAKSLVNRLLDWRDADDVEREGGAERASYRHIGVAAAPRNAPFESVEELRQVLGFADLPDKLLESLTVYTHTSMPYAPAAESAAQKALQYADRLQLAGHIWLMKQTDPAQVKAGTDPRGLILRVTACAKMDDYRRCRRAVLRLAGSATQYVQVYDWRSIEVDPG